MKQLLRLWAFTVLLVTPLVAAADAGTTPIVDPIVTTTTNRIGAEPTWFVALMGLVWAAQRALKDPDVPIPWMKPRWRPLGALLLGMLGAVTKALIEEGFNGQAFLHGLELGAAAGGGAILIQEVIVRALMGGRTEPGAAPATSVKPPPLPLLMLSLVFLFSCAGGAGQADRAIDSMADAISKSEPIVRAAYAKEIEACPDAPCVHRVQAEWDPVVKAFDKVHQLWCTVAPAAEGCS